MQTGQRIDFEELGLALIIASQVHASAIPAAQRAPGS
jgi:hypothetical protein